MTEIESTCQDFLVWLKELSTNHQKSKDYLEKMQEIAKRFDEKGVKSITVDDFGLITGCMMGWSIGKSNGKRQHIETNFKEYVAGVIKLLVLEKHGLL